MSLHDTLRASTPDVLQGLTEWEDLLTWIVEPDPTQVRDASRCRELLTLLLERLPIAEESFWALPTARRSRVFLERFSRASHGVPQLEISSFDLDRVSKERFRHEPLTIGAAWQHGLWRSYFSHAAITHPANDGLREEFSTAWDVLRRQPALLLHDEQGTRLQELAAERFDLPVLVGPLPHSDGVCMERAYLDAIRRSDPQRDLRTRTRVIVTSSTYCMHHDFYKREAELLLVRVPATELLPEHADPESPTWALVEEIAEHSRMLEIEVPDALEPHILREVVDLLHARQPQLLLSVHLRFEHAFWKLLYTAAQAPGVAMLHVHSAAERSYRVIPAVDALLKRERLRSRVQLVTAGGDSDSISSAAVVYEAILLGANAGSASDLAELALSPDFADVLRGADPAPVLAAIASRERQANADLASSTLSCWQHSILDFLSCMGIDDVQKTSGNDMAITWTDKWLAQTDALATPQFGRWNRELNLRRLEQEPIPAAEQRAFHISQLLSMVHPDLELVAAAQVLAHRNANYHLMNRNQNLTADHLNVIYRMAGGRFPEEEDFFLEGALGPVSLDGIGLHVSRRAIAESLHELRRNPGALDYINLCVPRGFLRPGAVSASARCCLARDADGVSVVAEFVADARGGFAITLPDLVPEGALYVVHANPADGLVAAEELLPVDAPTPVDGRGLRPAPGSPAGVSVRRASRDHRILLREDLAGGGFILEGNAVREPLFSAPVHHASISLGAAGEDFLRARLEGNQGLALTSSGEGGPLRLAPEMMRWESLQAASAHFGITAADVRAVRDVEIKINQGAKPGKGGRLAAPKVTQTVSRARNIPVGTDALSPDPKHDIYSIEDMPAEVWLWLHFGTHCGIKITGSTYTQYVAAGMWSNFVVDYLLVDAGLAGSGNYHADSSRVGWPDVFRTILHTHHTLLHEPLRHDSSGEVWPIRDSNGRAFGAEGGTKLLASGGLRSEMDMLKVLIAGADGLLEASIGKAVAFGCNQCGNCHLDCPRGGITTKAELTIQNDRDTMRRRFRNWSALNLVKLGVLVDAINRERGWVDAQGQVVQRDEVIDDIRKLRGRTDLLEMPPHPEPQPPLELPSLQELETVTRPDESSRGDETDQEDEQAAPAAEPAVEGAGSASTTPEPEHDSCRVGSLLVSEPVDVDPIWEAARLSSNGGNNRGGGISFAGFAPDPVRRRTCLVLNTIGPDRADTMARILDHLGGLRLFDAEGREMDHEEVRLRLQEFRVPIREEFQGEEGWQRAGLRENVGDVTLLFTELRGDTLWRYGRQLLESPHWLQRQVKYGAIPDKDLRAAIDRAMQRQEFFDDDDEPALLRAFLRDVKEEYYTTLAHLIDTRFYRTGLATPKGAERRSGYVVSMGEDLACIKISGWTHLIPAYLDFERFWSHYPGARERGGVRRWVRGEEAWTTALLAHVWGMHHRYPTNSPAIDSEGRGNPAGAHPFKAYNVLLMHNGEQAGVDSTAALITEHGHVHVDESMGPGAEEYAGDSLYERKALTDTEYAAYLVDFTRRVLGLSTEDATQIISPITGIDLEAVTPVERYERFQALSRNYVHLTPTGPYKFTILETRHGESGTQVGFRENMDIKFLRPHEIAINWDSAPDGVRAVANGSEAKIADAILGVLRQKGILADAGSDMRFNMRPGGRPGSGEMGGVFEAFMDMRTRELHLRNRFGDALAVERAGSKPDPMRALSKAVAGGRKRQGDEIRVRVGGLADAPESPHARLGFVDWVLERVACWSFDEYRTVVEWELPNLATHSDAHREGALWALTEIRKRLHLADTGGKSLAALEYYADGGHEYDGEPEGGIYRVLHAVPAIWETRASTGWSRIGFETRLDLAPPPNPAHALVIDMQGFASEAFGIEGAARFLSRAVQLGWRHLVTYNYRGGPRYLGTNLADAHGTAVEGVRVDLYGRQFGDFLGALLEGAKIHCYGQGQSHVGMKADRGYLFVLQDILNTGFYGAHGGTLSVWDSGSRFAVAGQNRVHLEDGETLAPGLKSIHFGSPNEYAFEYLMSGGENSIHVVMGLEKPDGSGRLRLRPRPYAGKFFMSGAAAGRVFLFDPERRMEPEQFHGNESLRPSADEWRHEIAPFLGAEADQRGLPIRMLPEGLRIRIGDEWREYSFDEAFTKYVPIRISRSAQRLGEAPPALVGMLDEL
jgi:glutamate synthase domain-containing protein 2